MTSLLLILPIPMRDVTFGYDLILSDGATSCEDVTFSNDVIFSDDVIFIDDVISNDDVPYNNNAIFGDVDSDDVKFLRGDVI
jgi:hypothetical protein